MKERNREYNDFLDTADTRAASRGEGVCRVILIQTIHDNITKYGRKRLRILVEFCTVGNWLFFFLSIIKVWI